MKNQNEKLVKWIGKTAKIMGAYANDKLMEHNISLTKTQVIVLKNLSPSEGISQNDLAYITERDKTSLTRLINTMEKKQLVYRTNSEVDKRINLIHMTDLGKELLSQANPIIEKIEQEIIKGISSKEIELAIQILRQVQANVNESVGV